jgi:membrane fusion protein, multidrug efflux system
MKRYALYICLFTLIGLYYGCNSSAENQAQTKKSDAKLVKVQPVQTKKLVDKLQIPGTLRAENVANILATTEGKISTMLVRESDRVEKDQVVAMISSLVREDIINSARLLMQAKNEQWLKDPENTKLKQELDQARQDYQFALQQYKEIPVSSPITGVVSQRWVDVGDMIPAKSKLFEIQSITKLLADVPVSELDIRKLKMGQTVEIFADACPERNFNGAIQRIYPQVEAKTRNAMVEIRILDPCPNLKAGMFVRVTFITRILEKAIAIPLQAIIDRPQKKICFIVNEGKAREVTVSTGLESEGWVEIVEGLNEGDALIVEGQEQLKNGSMVKIQGAPQKADAAEGKTS